RPGARGRHHRRMLPPARPVARRRPSALPARQPAKPPDVGALGPRSGIVRVANALPALTSHNRTPWRSFVTTGRLSGHETTFPPRAPPVISATFLPVATSHRRTPVAGTRATR